MESFELCDTSLLSYLNKNKGEERHLPEKKHSPSKDIAMSILQRSFSRVCIDRSQKETSLTKYDEKLVEHIKKHGGWNDEARHIWMKKGSVEAANRRIQILRENRFLDKKFKPTKRFHEALLISKEHSSKRDLARLHIIHQNRITNARDIAAQLSPEQKHTIATLAEFRQMTPSQTKMRESELSQLKERGLVESKTRLMDQKSVTLLTLTDKGNSKQISGKELAKHGLGIQRPFAGIQKDQSKLLHDVSVIDAIEHAKGKFAKQGYQFLGAMSEHRLYQEKESPNCDFGDKYADAYLLFRDSNGEHVNVALEFGNYPPGYMKEKVAGFEADHILVYTHDEKRGHEYENVIEQSNVEVFIINPPQSQELER